MYPHVCTCAYGVQARQGKARQGKEPREYRSSGWYVRGERAGISSSSSGKKKGSRRKGRSQRKHRGKERVTRQTDDVKTTCPGTCQGQKVCPSAPCSIAQVHRARFALLLRHRHRRRRENAVTGLGSTFVLLGSIRMFPVPASRPPPTLHVCRCIRRYVRHAQQRPHPLTLPCPALGTWTPDAHL